ncbi:MAG: imidazole glycerol phosphate synthase subunit HisH [Candidatus Omnitrophica bacterium]|nr:imidazole glycerol phosphate synthase subunit HisH [Candidatus Omnitrophota bacterium]
MIAIIDYGMGNLKSVYNAFCSLGAEVCITSDARRVAAAKHVVLPGVGAFGDAMRELDERNLIDVLKKSIHENKPFLGICLGFQLLFEESEENKGIQGLGVLPGRVKRFDILSFSEPLKIPHMGWNTVAIGKDTCPLMCNVPDEAYFYFVHSFYVESNERDIYLAETNYGIPFMSMAWNNMIFGAQFHPEKSQDVGLKILKNFMEL